MMAIIAVAKYIGMDPMAIRKWPNPMFLDVLEIIDLADEAEARQAKEYERINEYGN